MIKDKNNKNSKKIKLIAAKAYYYFSGDNVLQEKLSFGSHLKIKGDGNNITTSISSSSDNVVILTIAMSDTPTSVLLIHQHIT